MRDVVERYLQGRLSEAEEAAFEEAYLSDPALLDELELTEKLQRGLRQVAAREPLPPQQRRSFWSTPQYAAAASTLLAVSLLASGLLFVENRELREAASEPAGGPTRLLELVAVRSDDAMTIASPAPGERTVLLAYPGFGPYDRFDAVLTRGRDAAGGIVWQARGLGADFEGMIAVDVSGDLLDPGDYSLTLRGRAADWPADRASQPAGTYRFRIEAPTP